MPLRDLAYSISPTWLQGPVGERYIYSQAVLVDATAARVEEGSRSKMPGKCDPSCLQYIGRDRSVVRGPAESDASYAGRNNTAIYDWHFAGIAGGSLQAVLGYLSPAAPMARVVFSTTHTAQNITQWYTLADGAERGAAPDPFTWFYGSAPAYFSAWQWDQIDNRRRFFLILYINATGTPWATKCGKYGDGSKYGDGQGYGVVGLSPAQGRTLLSIIKDWKAGHGRCECVVISFDSTLFDPFYEGDLPGANSKLPDGNWGKYGKDVSGHYTRARAANARYLGSVG